MIESNDPLKLKQEVQARGRRRKSARWKSGLMLTGLGAVVAGAGYLAGVNAPAVNQSAASQTIARAGANSGDNQLSSPGNDGSLLNQGQGFQFNGGDGGSFQLNGDDGSNNPFGQQFGDNGTNQSNQQFGRRNRQLRGFSQQQPGFGGPVTRSRGS